MGREIERKFLVNGTWYRDSSGCSLIKQGYLCNQTDRVVRVRVSGSRGFITIKGKTAGLTRPEYEYEIPLLDAEEILKGLCGGTLIEKKRYLLEYQGFTWEVDEFLGANQGLVVAEIELAEETTAFPKPEWIGAEVTGDPRYLNANLIKKPYLKW